MNCKGIAVIAALKKDCIAPEPGDFRLMGWPIVDMNTENWAKAGVVAHGIVKTGHNGVDLRGGDRKARGKGLGHDAQFLRPLRKVTSRAMVAPPLTFAPLNPIRRGMSRISMPLHRIIGPAS